MKRTILLTLGFVSVMSVCIAQKAIVGAYYFDGWSGDKQELSTKLVNNFSERQPKWGWITSSQSVMDEQIEAAHSAGLSFFNFCWYNKGGDRFKTDPLNKALQYFRNSARTSELKYCLTVCNNAGFDIQPGDWAGMTNEWITQFKTSNYLLVDGKPLIVIYSINNMVKDFGGVAGAKNAIDQFRSAAAGQGLNGVIIGTVTAPDNKNNITLAQQCGLDFLTGYNYHVVGFSKTMRATPIANMQAAEQKLWNKFPIVSSLKYVPAVTLNWDPRAWANSLNHYDSLPYYVGYSPQSVAKSVQGAINWVYNNPTSTYSEKIIFLYAWNEMGEGAWLTPSKNGVNMLSDLRNVIY